MTIQSQSNTDSAEFKNTDLGKASSGHQMETDDNLVEMQKAIALIFNKALDEGNKVKGIYDIVDDVQIFLEAIIQGDIEKAEKYVKKFAGLGGKDLFVEVGKITRKLHDSIREFQDNINPRLKRLPVDQLPEASDKLQWVINKTEEAASLTINLVEKHLGYQEETTKVINRLESIFKETKGLKVEDRKAFDHLKEINNELPKDLMDIMIAQDFQDLTGQIIKKVIQLIADIEKQLVKIVTIFGLQLESGPKKEDLDGPQIKQQEGVASDQSEVDDILKGFGF
jgi:chemotaxis regulatin CheY-phosphate phosphatase CheZ